MSWISIALVGAGTAANVAGGAMTRNDALNTAQKVAAAKNAQLATNIGRLNQYGAQNEANFNTNMAGYSPQAQSALLSGSQASRGAGNVANIAAPNTGSIPLPPGTPSQVGNQEMGRLSDAFDYATQHAKAIGNLGGYSDQWTQNQLGNQNTGRNIDVSNLLAGNIKSMIPAEQQLAGMKAWQPPSIWGPLIQGAGSLMTGAGGQGLGNMLHAAPSSDVWSGYNTTGL